MESFWKHLEKYDVDKNEGGMETLMKKRAATKLEKSLSNPCAIWHIDQEFYIPYLSLIRQT